MELDEVKTILIKNIEKAEDYSDLDTICKIGIDLSYYLSLNKKD